MNKSQELIKICSEDDSSDWNLWGLQQVKNPQYAAHGKYVHIAGPGTKDAMSKAQSSYDGPLTYLEIRKKKPANNTW